MFFFAAVLLGLSFAIGAVKGFLPWQAPDANAFTNYHSPWNAVRIAKGALWALLLWRLFGRLGSAGCDVWRLFARGMVVGLAGTVMVILWERFAFPGLFNFADVYRVTGPFAQMHTGGADIETYLTVAAPFLVLLLFETRRWSDRLAGTVLLLGATYGVMVTFSARWLRGLRGRAGSRPPGGTAGIEKRACANFAFPARRRSGRPRGVTIAVAVRSSRGRSRRIACPGCRLT